MKYSNLLLLLFFSPFIVNGQPWMEKLEEKKTKREISFYDIQNAFQEYMDARGVKAGYYYKDGEKIKATGWKQFKRWEYIWEPRADKDGYFKEPTTQLKEYNEFKASAEEQYGDWSEIGPIRMPDNSTGQPNGLGRLNAVAFHPEKPEVIYVAAPSGGFWKTQDRGNPWISLTDTLPTLGTSSALVNPENPDEIYIGTGDRDAGDARGLGVWKTLDGGKSWNRVLNEDITVGMMVMHPENPDTILAATSYGIYRTLNGGQSWNRKQTGNFKDIELKPDSPDTLYATANGRFYRSPDLGENWNEITADFSADADRCVLAVSQDNPDYVYVVATKSGSQNAYIGTYRSGDNGKTFELRSDSPNLLGYSADGSDNRSQAWYDLCIAVDPNDAETIYVGAINIWKSTDGGASWNINAHWVGDQAPAVHADQHDLVFSPVDGRLYSANDGGIHYTEDGGNSWTEITNGLAIAQVYKIGQSSISKGMVINGYQDNGTSVASDVDEFTTVIGGDGMECIIDYTDEQYQYGSLYYGDIRRSTGQGFYPIKNEGSQNGIDEDGNWVTPFKLDHQNPEVMYAGYVNLWRTENLKTDNTSDIEWKKVTSHTSGKIVDLAQSRTNLDILYYSKYNQFYRIDNLKDNEPSSVNLSNSLPLVSTPTDILPHPTNENVVYITLYDRIYKSDDKGETWTNITFNLPSTYMNCLAIDTSGNYGLYAGTYLGVYFKNDTAEEWLSYNNGFPAIDVRELEIYYDTENPGNNALRAATYGRGLWESTLFTSGVVEFDAQVVDFKQIDLTWQLNSLKDSVLVCWSDSATFGTPAADSIYSKDDTVDGGGIVLYLGNDTTKFSHKGLSPQKSYHYRLWNLHNNEYKSWIQRSGETKAIPDPKNIVFTEIKPTELKLNWSLAQEDDTVLLVFSKDENFGVPVRDSLYKQGDTIEGGGEVLFVDTGKTFVHRNLDELTTYYYRFWSYNKGYYSDGISVSEKTKCTQPGLQISSLMSVDSTNGTLTLNWDRGGGDKVLVIGKKQNEIQVVPESGTIYDGSLHFGMGEEIGDETYVLYNGDEESIVVDSLQAFTQYHFAAFEYNESTYCYLTPGLHKQFLTDKNALIFYIKDAETELPVENAAVVIDSIETITDTEGKALFKLINGNKSYIVESEDYNTDTGEVYIDNEDKEVTIFLNPVVTSIEAEYVQKSKILVYPNPTNNLLTIEAFESIKNAALTVIDIQGKIVYSKNFEVFKQTQIDFSEYDQGMYFIRLTNPDNKVVKPVLFEK